MSDRERYSTSVSYPRTAAGTEDAVCFSTASESYKNTDPLEDSVSRGTRCFWANTAEWGLAVSSLAVQGWVPRRVSQQE